MIQSVFDAFDRHSVILQPLVQFLQPFKQDTEELSGSNCPTVNWVARRKSTLMTHCQITAADPAPLTSCDVVIFNSYHLMYVQYVSMFVFVRVYFKSKKGKKKQQQQRKNKFCQMTQFVYSFLFTCIMFPLTNRTVHINSMYNSSTRLSHCKSFL